MIDFVKVIESNPCLREYFADFPKQLMELACQGKIVKFSDNEASEVIVNMNLLRTYLMSPDSIFEIDTIEDFLESLNILGFQRSLYPEVEEENLHLCYRFANPLFTIGTSVPEDLNKQSSTTGCQALKFMKRLSGSGSVRLLQKLMRKKTCSELQVTPKELAHLKLKFALSKTQKSRGDAVPDVVEFNTEEPDYVKRNEIAGYYGNVTIEALEKGFQNYFPMFQDADATVDLPETLEPPAPSEEVELASGEPEKKKRKYTKKSREEIKETAEALLFLQKEAVGAPMEH